MRRCNIATSLALALILAVYLQVRGELRYAYRMTAEGRAQNRRADVTTPGFDIEQAAVAAVVQ